ncbi:Uncharacterized protein FWK35_00014010 [Aphis craccivora]|uniref:Uncharacterized protein n=1 Tax=Aphis craccivora TaxID=307492 RepID=A0A6G0Z5V1_APHCR|nr:Uncharacterized protein FWK35_00014010 [Aphis craccivora]
METKMYKNSSIENGWSDFVHSFLVWVVIARRRFLWTKNLRKLSG